MFSVITPTGDRPEAFALCEAWVKRQSVFLSNVPWEWIVVDDGTTVTKVTMGQTVVGMPPRPGRVTLGSNLRAGLEVAQGEKIIIVEDDDYYDPGYFANCLRKLTKYQLIGETPSRYYHVGARKFRQFENANHASLCQTAFRREFIPQVIKACKESFVDMTLWEQQEAKKAGWLYIGSHVVGIKGLPGRPGVSSAHTEQGANWESDVDMARLLQWIGRDGERYRQYARV